MKPVCQFSLSLAFALLTPTIGVAGPDPATKAPPKPFKLKRTSVFDPGDRHQCPFQGEGEPSILKGGKAAGPFKPEALDFSAQLYIGNNRSIAIINRKEYSPGDLLELGPGVQVLLKAIQPDLIIVNYQGKDYQVPLKLKDQLNPTQTEAKPRR